MEIIEKLGLEPLISCSVQKCTGLPEYMCDEKEVRELETQRNELLEVLIKSLELNQRGYFIKLSIPRDVIEKICFPKKWEEIKELKC